MELVEPILLTSVVQHINNIGSIFSAKYIKTLAYYI